MTAQFKNHLAYWLIRCLGCLPLSWLRQLGYGIGYLLSHTKTKTQQICASNIAACFPHLTPSEKSLHVQASLQQSAANLLEMMGIWQHSFAYGRHHIIKIHQEDLLDQALITKKGLLLILPHLGSWELTNHYITEKTPIMALYQPAKLSKVDQLIYQARTRPATEMVPTNRHGVKALYQHLKKNGVVVILPDQVPAMGSGYFANFFGIPAYTGVLVPKLLANTQAQCLCIFTLYHAEHGKFETYIQSVDPDIYNTDLSIATQAMNHSIEQCILKAIDQYQWTYQRFKYKL